METFLVTGGAGFIGSTLSDELLKRGNEVVSVDNFDPYYEREIKEKNIENARKNKEFHFIEMDIRDTGKLKEILEKFKISKIFHLAARAGVRFSVKDPYSYHDLNVVGTLSVLKASLQTNVKRILYASSSSVYGTENYLPVDENHPTFPISPYGASKLAGEAFCNSFASVFKMPIVSLRFFTAYGPRQRPDMAIHKFFRIADEEGKITIYGDGNQTRDFTYVDDIVNGTISAMESGATGVFNLGSGKRITVNELVDIISRVMNKDVKIEKVEKQLGDVQDTWANIEKAKNAFNYEPKIRIEEGIERFYSWFNSFHVK